MIFFPSKQKLCCGLALAGCLLLPPFADSHSNPPEQTTAPAAASSVPPATPSPVPPPGEKTAPAAQSSPTIKVTTRLVEINVVAHDRHGTAIPDLKKEDFEIKDQGKLQNISLFTVDTIGGLPGAPKQAVAQMPRNEASNRVDRQSNVPTSVTVILLDLANTKIQDQMYAHRQMIKFLKQIRPEDRIALYTMTQSGFKVVHDFTNNTESLTAALAAVKPGYQFGVEATNPDASNTGDDNLDATLDDANAAMAHFFQRNLIINTCQALKSLADHLAGMPGRKNLIWVSSAFPISIGYGDPQDLYGGAGAASGTAPSGVSHTGAMGIDAEMFAEYIEGASQAMNNANVAIYPVDARGLIGMPMADASKSFKINPRNPGAFAAQTHVDTRNMDTMNYIADLTGGKAFINSNDIEGAIRKAIDDSEVTYTLGYYVSDENWDNKFHRVKVSVKRSGVSLRTKKGYFAQEVKKPTSVQLERVTRDAVWSPLDATSIGILARVDPSPALAYASRVIFRLNPAEIQLLSEEGKYKGAIDVIMVQKTRHGKTLGDEKQTLQMNLSPETYKKAIANGLVAGRDIKVNPDTEAIRVVVVDRTNGSTGSVTIPISSQDKSGATVAAAPAAGASSPAPKRDSTPNQNPISTPPE